MTNSIPVETIPMWWVIGRWILGIGASFVLVTVACLVHCLRKFEEEERKKNLPHSGIIQIQ